MDSVNDIRLDYRRLKSSRGRFPVCGVELRNSARGHAEVAFSFAEAPASNSAAAPPFDLETLACSLPSYPLADQAELVERIRGAAQVCGPLLGEPTPESLTDWMAEIRIAQAALGIQRAINGDAPLNGPGVPVVKSRLVDERGNAVFTSFCLSLACGLEGETQLEGMFPRMPWMKRFSDEGSCDYAFVCADSLEGQRIIDLHLITFAQDVPTVDYSFMTAYFDALCSHWNPLLGFCVYVWLTLLSVSQFLRLVSLYLSFTSFRSTPAASSSATSVLVPPPYVLKS